MSSKELVKPYYPEHRKVVGWLISHNPKQLYELLERPSIELLPERVTAYADTMPVKAVNPLNITPREVTDQAIEQGVRDVSRIVRLMIANTPITDHASRPMQPDALIAAVANPAGLPNDEIETYFHVMHRRANQSPLQMTDYLQDPYELVDEEEKPGGGCPFAPYKQPRDPLFDRFVIWAGELAQTAWRQHDLSTGL